ncbi:peptidoglycan-binding protein, partial [Vibrio fluvialis]
MTRLTRRFASVLHPRLLPLFLAAFGACAQPAPPLVLKDSAPTTYTVVKGDTLWDI